MASVELFFQLFFFFWVLILLWLTNHLLLTGTQNWHFELVRLELQSTEYISFSTSKLLHTYQLTPFNGQFKSFFPLSWIISWLSKVTTYLGYSEFWRMDFKKVNHSKMVHHYLMLHLHGWLNSFFMSLLLPGVTCMTWNLRGLPEESEKLLVIPIWNLNEVQLENY